MFTGHKLFNVWLIATAEIDLTATLIDINGNVDISGTTTFNTVAYTWPSSQGAASTNLQNNINKESGTFIFLGM